MITAVMLTCFATCMTVTVTVSSGENACTIHSCGTFLAISNFASLLRRQPIVFLNQCHAQKWSNYKSFVFREKEGVTTVT